MPKQTRRPTGYSSLLRETVAGKPGKGVLDSTAAVVRIREELERDAKPELERNQEARWKAWEYARNKILD